MDTILTIAGFAALALCACSGTSGPAAELGVPVDLAVKRDLSAPQQDASTCSPPDAGGKTCPINLPAVLVQGGMGQIGASYKVADFYLDVYEVTVGAYRLCQQAGACTAPDTAAINSLHCNFTSTAGTGEDQPVNCVDFSQATRFCEWAGRRLPTEGEWAYAAFGPAGAMSSYPWGDQAPIASAADGGLPQLCWDQSQGTCPGGSFPKTLLGSTISSGSSGVADLAGDVWEWTSGQYRNPYTAPETPCTTSCSIRGGSWVDDFPANFGPAERNDYQPTDRLDNLGFRCARTAP